MGLAVPAAPAPARGHWLARAYVPGSYSPVLAPGRAGYGVQPNLRYVPGNGLGPSSNTAARPNGCNPTAMPHPLATPMSA